MQTNKLILQIQALRYLYYCKNISLISDYDYDMLERNAKKLPGGEVLNVVSSDLEISYSKDAIDLALNLLNRNEKIIL